MTVPTFGNAVRDELANSINPEDPRFRLSLAISLLDVGCTTLARVEQQRAASNLESSKLPALLRPFDTGYWMERIRDSFADIATAEKNVHEILLAHPDLRDEVQDKIESSLTSAEVRNSLRSVLARH